jgi:ribose 5-phosphate isomerase B
MIHIGADKHGLETVKAVIAYLNEKNIPFKNLGVASPDEDMKLEDLIPAVVNGVRESKENKGVLICGTGVGVVVGANKFSGIRAILGNDEKIVEWSRQYDDCNVLCFAGWNLKSEAVQKMLNIFLNTNYDGDAARLSMIKTFDTWH